LLLAKTPTELVIVAMTKELPLAESNKQIAAGVDFNWMPSRVITLTAPAGLQMSKLSET
jgi:hypothetical protein